MSASTNGQQWERVACLAVSVGRNPCSMWCMYFVCLKILGGFVKDLLCSAPWGNDPIWLYSKGLWFHHCPHFGVFQKKTCTPKVTAASPVLRPLVFCSYVTVCQWVWFLATGPARQEQWCTKWYDVIWIYFINILIIISSSYLYIYIYLLLMCVIHILIVIILTF